MRWIRNRPNSTVFWLTVAAVVLVGGVVLPAAVWDWLRSGTIGNAGESNSTTIRNVGFLIAGALALVFAVWRGVLAQRQAATAERQAETALRQTETAQYQAEIALRQTATAQHQVEIAQQGLLNERYQKGAEMLGSEVLAVRLGGIYALQRLAGEQPVQYHLQVMRLLCAFVRLASPINGGEPCPQIYEGQSEQPLELRPDVQDAMKAIALRGSAGVAMESREEDNTLYLRDAQLMGLQLRNANLSKAWLTKANLSRAVLPHADLSGARLRLADLSGAELRHSDLSNAVFWGADLAGAVLWNANLSGSDFSGVGARSSSYGTPAHGLTQAQLDQTWADADNPPKLNGILDANTGEPLVWRGNQINTGP